MKITGVIASLVLVWITAAFTQSVTSKTAPVTVYQEDLSEVKDFRPLFQERQDLIVQLQVLETSLKELQDTVTRVGPVEKIKSSLHAAEADLASMNKATSKSDPAKAAYLGSLIENMKSDLKAAEDSGPNLKQIPVEITVKRKRLFDVEQRIASLYDATRDANRFRSSATYTFGVLVFIVVFGFYLIAWNKDGVAKTIFSGELGMQLITLFLIVIAIILFGIMGTLEGKELAALLGGLSGYILGKVGGKGSASEEPAK